VLGPRAVRAGRRSETRMAFCVNYFSMKSRYAIARLALVLVLSLSWARGAGADKSAIGSGVQAIAATIHPLATDAAVQALRQGGNAIDAAIAAALTLGIVDGHNSGLGGGCFMVIRLADGREVVIDGREKAPAAATRDMFVRDGKPDAGLSQTGALAAGVPGALAAYEYAARTFGELPLANHLRVAAQLAEQGFALNRSYAQRLAATAEDLRRFEASRVALLKPDGAAWEAGEILRQPDLAATYRALASEGASWFYKGPFARRTEEWMRANGGLMTAEDFGRYAIELREPVRTTYRGYEILGFPPPSSGGVHVAQILNILEQFKVRKLRAGSADFIHLVTEAMKLAFADRAFWLGDPDFAKVPRGLVAKEYAAELAKRIDKRHARPVPGHATPSAAETDLFGKHRRTFPRLIVRGIGWRARPRSTRRSARRWWCRAREWCSTIRWTISRANRECRTRLDWWGPRPMRWRRTSARSPA